MSKSLFDRISEHRRLLGNPYAYLDGDGGISAVFDPKPLKEVVCGGADIERAARAVQLELWKRRVELGFSSDAKPSDVLQPDIALRLIGFDVRLEETLGRFRDGTNREIEVAGVFDAENLVVSVSRQVPHDVRLFTLAHELGHAVFGHQTGLHRDRPLNGESVSRDPIEAMADKFATAFLMPRKLVCSAFEEAFFTRNFVLSDATVFALARCDLSTFKKKFPSRRALARVLASTDRFNREQIVPLNKRFRVSVEAMAIRLEELELV